MSAPAFDPDDIAHRVQERQDHARPPVRGTLPPLGRSEGSCVTGTGDSQGRPLPLVAEGDGSDIFERLDRQRARHQVQSPFGPRDQRHVTPTTTRRKVEQAADEERFVAPELDDEMPESSVHEEPQWDNTSAPASAATGAVAASTPSDPPAAPSSSSATTEAAGADDHDGRCGEILSGGGAPRGWVLVRIIGAGQARRYCSPACAIAMLDDAVWPGDVPAAAAPVATRTETVPQRTESVPAAGTGRPRVGRPSGLVAQHVDEIIRRYQAGETTPQIGRALGHTAKTVRDALDRAGIQRRDDRVNASGGANRIEAYPEQMVAEVRRLYVDGGLNQRKVGEKLGVSAHVIQRLMERHGIEARPPAHQPNDPNEAARRRKLSTIGKARTDQNYPVTKIRAWARKNGIRCPDRGRFLPREMVQAYEAAHGGASVMADP